jgi:dTDP-4-dehydrorhamnose reductase
VSRTCLIGYSGFVGSNLQQQYSFDDLYRSSNIQEIRGKSYGLVVISGVSAAKWRANKAPDEDRQAIQGLLDNLANIKADRVVLMSTVDVYPIAANVDESFHCASRPNHAYGTNRLYVEESLKATFKNVFVMRLSGLFGPGLKKNVIYDLLHDNCLNVINPDSVFQYYDMTAIWDDVQVILKQSVPLINLASEPVATSLIRDICFPGKEIGTEPAPPASYDVRSLYTNIFGTRKGYRFDSGEVMNRLGRYIQAFRAGVSA